MDPTKLRLTFVLPIVQQFSKLYELAISKVCSFILRLDCVRRIDVFFRRLRSGHLQQTL